MATIAKMPLQQNITNVRQFTHDPAFPGRYTECSTLNYSENFTVTHQKRKKCWLLSSMSTTALLVISGCSALPGRSDQAAVPAAADAKVAATHYPSVPQPQTFAQTRRRNYPAQPAGYSGSSTPWSGLFGGTSGNC